MITPGENAKRPEPKKEIKISNKDREDVDAFFSKLEVGDLCFMDILEFGLALFGQTKAGKTTLAHYLISNPLVGTKEGSYELRGGSKFLEAIIGHSPVSQTEIPNEITKQIKATAESKEIDIHILDCPGYSDSKGCHMVIANGYFHYRIFSKVKNLKFLITFDYSHMSGVYDKPTNTLVEFLLSFKNFGQIKDAVINATSFVFTKLDRQGYNDAVVAGNIEAKLIALRNCGNLTRTDYWRDLQELIDVIIASKRYYFFEKGKDNTPAPQENKLLQEIHEKTSFWTRNLVEGDQEVDMSNIQMTLGNRATEISQTNSQFKHDLQILTALFKQRFSRSFLSVYNSHCSLQRITIQFLTNSILGNAKQKSFYSDHLLQFIKTYNIYSTNDFNSKKEYEKKRKAIKNNISNVKNDVDTFQIENIQKLEICKMIIDLAQDDEYILGSKKGEERTLQQFKDVAKRILSILVQFKKIRFFNPQEKNNGALEYTNKIEEFIYILYRLLQEAKTFRIIFATDSGEKQNKLQVNNFTLLNLDATRIIFDYIQSLLDEQYDYISLGDKNVFEKAKFTFFTNQLEIYSDQTESYYNEIETYFKIGDGLKELPDLMKAAKIKHDEMIRYKLNSVKIKANKNDRVLTLVSYAKSKLGILQNEENELQLEKNVELYLQSINKLAYELSSIDQKSNENKKQSQKALKHAIKLFRSSNNVFKAIESYKELVKKYDIQKEANQMKETLTEFAVYASTHGRIELAIEMYQQAFSLIDWMFDSNQDGFHNLRKEQREILSQKIGMLGIQKRYNPSMPYYDSLLKKKWFTTIDPNIFEEINRDFSKKK